MMYRIELTQEIICEVDIEADTLEEARKIAFSACEDDTIEDYGVTEKDASAYKVCEVK